MSNIEYFVLAKSDSLVENVKKYNLGMRLTNWEYKNRDFSEIISAGECDSIFQNVQNVQF